MGQPNIPRDYLPKNQLPGNYQRAVAKRKSRLKFPRWFTDDTIRERVFRVYRAYVKRTPIPVIAAQEGISLPQVYVDVRRAKEERRIRWAMDADDQVMEAVNAHEEDIRNLRRDLRRLQNTGTPSPGRATAEAKLYGLIREHQRDIEELTFLRGGGANISVKRGDGDGSEGAVQVVINMDGPAPQVIDAVPTKSIEGEDGLFLKTSNYAVLPSDGELDAVERGQALDGETDESDDDAFAIEWEDEDVEIEVETT